MDSDNLVEAFLGPESESFRPFRIEPARPTLDDTHDTRVRRAADASCNAVACDTAQSLDLLRDSD